MQNENEIPNAAKLAEHYADIVPATIIATGLNRSTDQVAREMRAYVESGDIGPEDHAQLVWLFHHGKVEKQLKSFDDVGKLIGYKGATISRLFAGKYEGNLQNVLEAVRGYQHLDAERAKMAGDKFIENSIWETVRDACDLALLRSAPVRVVGVSQIGKTHSLLEYKRRSKLPVYYMRVPAAPTFRNFMDALADAVGVTTSARSEELRRRIPGALGRQTLLIVDELHELALSAGRSTAMKCMEFLREVWDNSKCGLLPCGTMSMENDLINSPSLRSWLGQFDQRCIRRVILPTSLPWSDVVLAAETYGFPPPGADVQPIVSTLRMNRLVACLSMAASKAAKAGTEKTWKQFVATYKKNFGGDL